MTDPRSLLPAIALALAAGLIPESSFAQQPVPDSAPSALLVFLDCNADNCDFDHFRREIPWVSWVRDREDADLHLLITDQETGGGGQRYTLVYIGRRALAETEKTLSFVSDPNQTDAEVREGLTRTMAVGLVQFVEGTPLASRLQVLYREPEHPVAAPGEHDPWNLWVFQVGTEGSLEGEAQQSRYTLEGSASATRVSEQFKISFSVDAEYEHERFELDDTTTVDSQAENYDADLLMVWSLGDHWSAGGLANASRSTFLNRDLSISAGPAVEYNLFPYRESTRRSLTVRYQVGFQSFDYQVETIEGKLAEVHPGHALLVSAAVQQPWGEIYGQVEGIQYLHDLASHRINTFLRVEYRLFRGLNLDLFVEFARIKDQFYLPGQDLSEEEVLLERRQRETDFQYDVGIGLSYRFGSKFANIVNPRF
jgi:hypothetical protein